MAGVLVKSGRFGDPQSRHRKANYTEMEAEVKVSLPQAKEHKISGHWVEEARKNSHLTASKGAWGTANSLTSDS